jgi:hypothetical protein
VPSKIGNRVLTMLYERLQEEGIGDGLWQFQDHIAAFCHTFVTFCDDDANRAA